ncbi:MAG: hypothetical protein H6604_01370 [Flavobacteriales bacterium]|nr:hypothetical protein [Flavobacteriales bacterium]
MHLDKFVVHYLKSADTLIFPYFGMLYSIKFPAEFSKDKTVLNPPYKKLFFEVSKINKDYSFLNFLSQKMNIDEDEASVLFKNYTKKIISELENSKLYKIEELGSFYKENENVVFETSENYIMIQQFGLESIIL